MQKEDKKKESKASKKEETSKKKSTAKKDVKEISKKEKKVKPVKKEKEVKLVEKKEDVDYDEEKTSILTSIKNVYKGITLETKKIALGTALGLLAGILIMVMFWPKRIAKLANGEEVVFNAVGETITADDLYANMKQTLSVSSILDMADDLILSKKYPTTDSMKEEATTTAEYYINTYTGYYGYTEEEFLLTNGFANKDAFVNYLVLENKRQTYHEDYLKGLVTDKEIEDYYNKSVYGDIKCQHILVKSGSTPDTALATAKEIITKLNNGTTWEQVQKDYASKITFEDLGYQAFDASLEESFLKALAALKDNSYSTTPVETSYGYHIIYRFDQKEKPTLEESKESIIKKIASTKDTDSLIYKSLIELRKENNLEILDTELKTKYEAYAKKYE